VCNLSSFCPASHNESLTPGQQGLLKGGLKSCSRWLVVTASCLDMERGWWLCWHGPGSGLVKVFLPLSGSPPARERLPGSGLMEVGLQWSGGPSAGSGRTPAG